MGKPVLVVDPYYATGIFLYHLETWENLWFSMFLELQKQTNGMKWVSWCFTHFFTQYSFPKSIKLLSS